LADAHFSFFVTGFGSLRGWRAWPVRFRRLFDGHPQRA